MRFRIPGTMLMSLTLVFFVTWYVLPDHISGEEPVSYMEATTRPVLVSLAEVKVIQPELPTSPTPMGPKSAKARLRGLNFRRKKGKKTKKLSHHKLSARNRTVWLHEGNLSALGELSVERMEQVHHRKSPARNQSHIHGPKGKPMVKRQVEPGMKDGTGEQWPGPHHHQKHRHEAAPDTPAEKNQTLSHIESQKGISAPGSLNKTRTKPFLKPKEISVNKTNGLQKDYSKWATDNRTVIGDYHGVAFSRTNTTLQIKGVKNFRHENNKHISLVSNGSSSSHASRPGAGQLGANSSDTAVQYRNIQVYRATLQKKLKRLKRQ